MGIKPYRSYKIKDGITNINYKIFTNKGIFVMRVPRKDIVGINFKNQEKVLNLVKDINIDVIYYNANTGVMISKFIDVNKNKKVSFDVVVKHLKKLHSINQTDIAEFDPFKLINTYKQIVNNSLFNNEEKVIEKAKEIYERYPRVLCHNDVLYANFLISKDKDYLIDYEYAGGNIALFDVVSFLSENNIDDESLKLSFINKYFDKVDDTLLNDTNTMFMFLDILWGYWANAMYIKYEEKVFYDIALEKLNRYNLKNDNS